MRKVTRGRMRRNRQDLRSLLLIREALRAAGARKPVSRSASTREARSRTSRGYANVMLRTLPYVIQEVQRGRNSTALYFVGVFDGLTAARSARKIP